MHSEFFIHRQAANLALARGQMPVNFCGRASEKLGVILVQLIDYSGKLPSGPVKCNPKFAACTGT